MQEIVIVNKTDALHQHNTNGKFFYGLLVETNGINFVVLLILQQNVYKAVSGFPVNHLKELHFWPYFVVCQPI